MIHLLAPVPGNVLTGGHLYNRNIAQRLSGRLRLESVEPENLERRLASARQPVILDSLYLFQAALPTSQPCLLLAHYLPSLEPSLAPDKRNDAILREARWFSLLDGVIVPSEFMRTEVESRGVPGAKIRVCRPAVAGGFRPAIRPLRRFRRSAESRGSPLRIVTVANLTPSKGHLFLLAALEGLDDLPWTWEIVGSAFGAEAHALMFVERCARSPIAGRIRLVGALSQFRTARLLRSADLFALATEFETYGTALAEARGCGIPIVANRVGGVPEAAGSHGFLCDPGDLRGWRSTLRAILIDPALRASYARPTNSGERWSWRSAARLFHRSAYELVEDRAHR